MSTTPTLPDELRHHGLQHKDTELGKVLQWAALHIEGLAETLDQYRVDFEDELNERIRLERALHDAKTAIEAALATVSRPLCPPIELGRDLVPHINLMAGHGDPDYLKANGQSIRHVDTRTAKPRAKK